jgi:flagellar capping protein FliD
VPSALIQVTDGVLTGTGDFTGLSLAVTGTGTSTMTLSRGVGQVAKDIIAKITGVGAGGINSIMDSVLVQNQGLSDQIATAQTRLDREKELLKQKFAKMESVVAQMRASAGSLTGA